MAEQCNPAQDYIRILIGQQPNGLLISKESAALILSEMADILGLDPSYLEAKVTQRFMDRDGQV